MMIAGVLGNADRVMNAINWDNISGAQVGSNSDQTVAGINAPVSLRVDFSGVGAPEEFDVNINSGGDTIIATGAAASSSTFQVINGDTIHFRAVNTLGAFSCTCTVVNVTTGATLDTFSVALTG